MNKAFSHSIIRSFGSHSLLGVNLLIFILILISTPGCLVFEKISYEIKLNEDKSGSAKIYVTDLTSDASDDEAFSQDTSALFSFMLKSSEFIEDMKSEGRFITSRKLILTDDKLDAEAEYNFNNIAGVENIAYEDGFFYLTIDLADSVISTNGEIIKSKNYKRILWDDKQKLLKFEIFSVETDAYRKLAPYYIKQ